MKLVYIGNMGASYDLETVIEAVKRLEGMELVLAGDGPKRSRLERLAAGCGRIEFAGYLDEAALERLLAASEVGLIPMFEASRVAVPGKLADYAKAGLKVIYSLGGETAALVGGAGVKYEAGDAESFCRAVERVKGAEKLRPEDFAADRAMADYAKWLEEVCSPA